ncbi:MAG: 4-vinyl reductase [Proteobacteria bacterium]|nr:4-vinyl reductase [Pseudomonadota bacterium]
MFREERDAPRFSWEDLGDIGLGRPSLGPETSVVMYRLMQFTLRDIIITEYGPHQAGEIFYRAGRVAGAEFCRRLLDISLEFDAFAKRLGEVLAGLKIGFLRIEGADLDKLTFSLAVEEDLDCSGLPVTHETVCDYDEGFISGILSVYTGRDIRAVEVDCWASGGQVCRFECAPVEA